MIINSAAPVAMYYQLKEILLHDIQNGVWAPHEKIISEREMMEKYNVSRVTARKAVEQLTKEGFVYTVRGKGTFVKGKYFEQPLNHFYSFREDLCSRGVEARSEMLGFSVIQAGEEMAEKLRISQGEEVFMIERLFSAGDLPYSKEYSYIPCRYCAELSREEVEQQGLYNSLKRFNIYPSRAREKIKAVNLKRETAIQLGVSSKDAAIYLTRTTYCNDLIIELNIAYIRGDMFVYSVELQN